MSNGNRLVKMVDVAPYIGIHTNYIDLGQAELFLRELNVV